MYGLVSVKLVRESSIFFAYVIINRFMQNLVSKVPIMVVEGNHEIEEQVQNQTFVAYSSRFAFPSKESGSLSTFYYSFNSGGIHFIMLGAYIAYNKTGLTYFAIIFICFFIFTLYWMIVLTL